MATIGRVRRRRRSGAGDAGTSLIETILAIGILGTVGVGVLGALLTALHGAGSHQLAASTQARLQTASEVVRGSQVPYLACTGDPVAVADSYAQSLAAGLPQAGSAVVVEIESVTFWNGSDFVPACTGIPGDTLQLVRLRAWSGSTVRAQSITKLPGPVVP